MVGRNSLNVAGPSRVFAFGGGIAMYGGDLTLEPTIVVANSASPAGATAPLGFGGVFIDSGVVRTRTVIAGNKPDNCSGY
jgi:hypothetical protein